MAEHTPTRTDEIKAIHREYKFFYQVLGGSLLVAIGILIGAIAFSSDLDRSAYFINLYTSLLSILVTVFVIDFLNRRREEQRELRQLQEQLVRDAGSTSNETAKNAIHQLKKRGWLKGDDSLLRNANLHLANLSGVNFFEANLQGTILSWANLQKANFACANLQYTDLKNVKLQGADLSDVNLEGGNLHSADLSRANLMFTNLHKAKLKDANLSLTDLQYANLTAAILEKANFTDADVRRTDFRGAEFDETTILPDGSHWTPDTDLTKFGCIIE